MRIENRRFWQHPYGVNKVNDNLQVSFVSEKKDCGIILYDKKSGKELKRISFHETQKIGNVFYMDVEDVKPQELSWLFYEDEQPVVDKYAEAYKVNGEFGEPKGVEAYKAVLPETDYDWEEDSFPCISYGDSIVYGMHVRGFTRHSSSGVKGKGTFAGVIEKIPYLKDLGITTVELQPIYEFNEMPEKNTNAQVQQLLLETPKLNYWGYQDAYYYAPKQAYAYKADASMECKDMIKTFHKNHMEVIMQVYFKHDTPVSDIIQVLRFWHIEYHIDGFHLIGEVPHIKEIAKDAFLSNCKLWYQQFPINELYASHEKLKIRRLATYNDGYMYDMRRFIKGDEGMLYEIMKHMRINPSTNGVINFITNYYGFTMADLVSYDRKYNEANGEDNKDGVDYNFSWNCGAEGSTRKKQVVALREKQMRNAFTLLMLSQGTPFFFMGDEFGNSQKGNNNPYCQDNDITWLNWKDLNKNQEMYTFVKELIALRKSTGVFHLPKECMIMDYKSCGSPDISYHGSEAWKPSWEHYSRHIGFMLCGEYAEGCEGSFYYVAVNMHWEDHDFALPKLPKNKKWKKLMTTGKKDSDISESAENTVDAVYRIEKRSITVFISK